MKEAFPDYYHKFKCIADKCKHNCCIGWEIDIDEDTFELYSALDTPLGKKLRENITGEMPHFELKENDRCPMLTENGLCEIILECGEDALCDICSLHPRFRNFYSDFVETGLGLSCEEAARIILFTKEKFSVKYPENIELTEEEKNFFAKREEIFSILLNREKTVYDRFLNLSKNFNFDFDFCLQELADIYLSLERLDASWTNELNRLKKFKFDKSVFEDERFATAFEQLAVYFIFRHLPSATSNGNYGKIVKFALMSSYIIGALFACHAPVTDDKMIDIVRMYSAEIEYSEENTEKLINI